MRVAFGTHPLVKSRFIAAMVSVLTGRTAKLTKPLIQQGDTGDGTTHSAALAVCTLYAASVEKTGSLRYDTHEAKHAGEPMYANGAGYVSQECCQPLQADCMIDVFRFNP